jgi:hypothetical protein
LDRPRDSRNTISLDAEQITVRIGQSLQIRYKLPWRLGDHGFIKIFSSGAQLSRKKAGLFVTPVRPGEISIDMFAVESGRETFAGKLRLTAK